MSSDELSSAKALRGKKPGLTSETFDEKSQVAFSISIGITVRDPKTKKQGFRVIHMLPEDMKKYSFGIVGSTLQREFYEQLRIATKELLLSLEQKGDCKEGQEHKWRPYNEKQDFCVRCTSFRPAEYLSQEEKKNPDSS